MAGGLKMKVELVKQDGTVVTLYQVGAVTTGDNKFTVVFLDGHTEEFLNSDYKSITQIAERML